MTRLTLLVLALISLGSAHAETTAIVGATVHTVGPKGTIENGTVVLTDGRIVAVGDNVSVPPGATVVDASGKILTPGLFTPIGSLGLVEVGFSAGPVDSDQRGDQFTASFDVAGAFNRRSTLIPVNRIEGVTRALIAPNPGGMDEAGNNSSIFSGLASVVNLGDGDPIDRRGAAMIVSLGERGVDYAGGSRAAVWLQLRYALNEAIDYREHNDAYERGQHSDYKLSVADLEALQAVISGAVPLLAFVDRASDIEELISLEVEYGIRAIIGGGAEAWMLAPQIAAANIPVILAPTANLPSNFDRLNASAGSAAILADAGVTIAFADGQSQTHNARNITQSAGNASAEGLSWDAALRAITLSPAEMYGVADQVGSIELGKDADLVIWPGDPLELTNYPEQVFIKGESVPMLSRQTLLRDRYLDTDDKRPPAYRN